MKILFVRHGHPDYKANILTETGRLQAEAAAERLADEKIDEFFSSPLGRAYETCEFIARAHGREADIITLPFMREINWGSKDGEPLFRDGHPWAGAREFIRSGERIMRLDWAEIAPFNNNRVVESVEQTAQSFDEWLKDLGYTREGDYYRVGKAKYGTVLIASHAGSSSAVISHLLNLPFPFFCNTFCPDFTSITEIDFSGDEGTLICPRMELFGDARHIKKFECERIISK